MKVLLTVTLLSVPASFPYPRLFTIVLMRAAHTRTPQALLETEGVELLFTDAALHAIARAAEAANRLLDNIGARRLHTVLVSDALL